MNLGEFHEMISQNIRRGDAVDAFIPGFVRKGARWIERNHTLQYMRKFATVLIDPEDEDARYISLLDTQIKSVEMLRWIGDDGSYAYATLRDPRDYSELVEGTPEGYWLDGVSRIVLNTTPDEEITGELMVTRYTSWPTATSATHWLIDNAEDILEAQAMINFGKHARDAELMAFWKSIRDEAIMGLYAAEREFQDSNVDWRMEYNGH